MFIDGLWPLDRDTWHFWWNASTQIYIVVYSWLFRSSPPEFLRRRARRALVEDLREAWLDGGLQEFCGDESIECGWIWYNLVLTSPIALRWLRNCNDQAHLLVSNHCYPWLFCLGPLFISTFHSVLCGCCLCLCFFSPFSNTVPLVFSYFHWQKS